MSFILGIIFLLIVIKCYSKFFTMSSSKSKVSLAGKTVIVTGANSGIGFETAKTFASRGAKVILGCRSEKKANEAREAIVKATENENVIVGLIDFSSLESVRKFAKVIIETEDRLDILVNNAGIGSGRDMLTTDGLQFVMQVNYFGPVLLTMLLLDLLKKSAPSRIINVSSVMAMYSNLTADNINSYTGPYRIYNNSKLGNILFTQRLAKVLKDSGVTVYSLHPGAIKTEIFSKFRGVRKAILQVIMMLYFKNAEEGAQTTIYTALQQGIEPLSGSHFDNCNAVGQYGPAKNESLEKSVWDKTMNLIGFEGEAKELQ